MEPTYGQLQDPINSRDNDATDLPPEYIKTSQTTTVTDTYPDTYTKTYADTFPDEAADAYYGHETNPIEDDPEGIELEEKVLKEKHARTYYGDRPKPWEFLVAVLLMVYGILLMYTGALRFHNGCQYYLAEWAICAGIGIFVCAVGYLFVRQRYFWDRKRDSPSILALVMFGLILFFLFVWAIIGTVWTFNSWDCHDTEDGRILFFWCFVTVIIFLILFLVVLLGALLLFASGAETRMSKLLTVLANHINQPYARIPLYFIMIVIGVVVLVLAIHSWDVENCDQPLTQWMLTLGIMLIIAGVVCLIADVVLLKLIVDTNRRINKMTEPEPLILEECAASLAKAKRRTMFVVYKCVLTIFIGGIIGVFFLSLVGDKCKKLDLYWDANFTLVAWIIVIFLLLLYLLATLIITPSVIQGMTIGVLNRSLPVNLFVLIASFLIMGYATVTLFIGGRHYNRDCKTPLPMLTVLHGILLLELCLVAIVYGTYTRIGLKDLGNTFLRIILTVSFILYVLLGGVTLAWLDGTSQEGTTERNCDQFVTDWTQGEVAVFILIIFGVLAMTIMYLVTKNRKKNEAVNMDDYKAFQREEREKEITAKYFVFQKVAATSSEFWVVLCILWIFFCGCCLFVTGFHWELDCEEPLKEFLLVFGICAMLVALLLFLKNIMDILTVKQYSSKLRILFEVPAWILAFFISIWSVAGMVWFFKADACVSSNPYVYSWTFYSLLMLLLTVTGLGLAYFYSVVSKSTQKTTSGGPSSKRVKLLKRVGWILVAAVAVSGFSIALLVTGIQDAESINCDIGVEMVAAEITMAMALDVVAVLACYISLKMWIFNERFGAPWRIPVFGALLLLIFISGWASTTLFRTEDCHDDITDTFNLLVVAVIGVFTFFLLLVFAIGVANMKKDDELFEETEYVGEEVTYPDIGSIMPEKARPPIDTASLVFYTIFATAALYAAIKSLMNYHADCDEPLREYTLFLMTSFLGFLFVTFMGDIQSKVFPATSRLSLYIISAVIIALVLAIGIAGIIMIDRSKDCSEKSEEMYNTVIYCIVGWGVWLVYVVFRAVRALLNIAAD